MKVWMVFPIAVMVLAAESTPAAKKAAKPKPAPAAAVKITKIPEGAVQIDSTSYRYTTPDGKSQLYKKSPFGIMKVDEQATPAAITDPSAITDHAAVTDHANDGVKATVDGDTIHFERPSPFGTFRWQKKISELSEEERALWQAQSSRGVPAQD